MEFLIRELLEECEMWDFKLNLYKSLHMVCRAKTKSLIVEDPKGALEDVKNLK